MTHSNSKNNIYITRNVMFDMIEHYIREIYLIDRTRRPIKTISQLQPIQPTQIKTQIAVRPESIRFIGSYVEDWEISLN